MTDPKESVSINTRSEGRFANKDFRMAQLLPLGLYSSKPNENTSSSLTSAGITLQENKKNK
ncbi:hypothetical protein HOT69_gp044 [Cyanophage S-TIM4]|uniref:Uncharacterized protein n=2 Tax=Thaumasvirus stim4 TaxID=2734148 RepID=A0A345AWS6_9CAUD|nr:hypothetical protein HOT69_gp044 [Cyanophage S-TIM4]AXF41359.1 unknown [Cyanophage S-TIM4]